MSNFVRFPHTPHLAWLGKGPVRNDKVLTAEQASELLAGEVTIEEKIDGANLGISLELDGSLQVQNRGQYLSPSSELGQWKPLARWLRANETVLKRVLKPGLIIFGEWCYAVHSVKYTRLPDWFLVFDVYDTHGSVFWSVDRRNALAQDAQLATVPFIARGTFTLSQLITLLQQSHFADCPAEGVYIRRDLGPLLHQRAKLVRSEFVQGINSHWSAKDLQTNQLYAP